MRTIKRPEIFLSLAFLFTCLVWFLFRDTFFLPFLEYSGLINVTGLAEYRAILFVFIVALTIYGTVRYFRIKAVSSEKQYFHLFDSNPLSMGIFDKKSLKFVSVNKAAIECYGYSKKEFLSLTINSIRADDENADIHPAQPLSGETKNSDIWKHRKKNGETLLAEISWHDVTFKNTTCRLIVARDVTELLKAKEEKKLAENEIIKQKNFTTYVLENFPVEVAIFDKNHRYLLINRVAIKNDEIREWMIGKNDHEYFKMKGMDTTIADMRKTYFNKALSGEIVEWTDEHIQNGELKYILRKMYPLKENGQLKYVYGYGIDITDVRKAQAQKDEYIQQLEKIAFTTSHKVRQPICNMQGLINLLNMGTFNEKELKELVGCMQSSIQILDEYTKELAEKLHDYKHQLSISFSKNQKTEIHQVN